MRGRLGRHGRVAGKAADGAGSTKPGRGSSREEGRLFARRHALPMRPTLRPQGARGGVPEHGRAFSGARSLDLLVIVRVAACIILAAVLTGGILFALYRSGVLHDPHDVPVSFLVMTVAISALVTLLVLTVLAHRLLKPIRELRAAMERVAQGDFSARVEDDGADNELGTLLRSFNTMAAELGSTEMLRDGFIDDFSHEFKTPITSIRGFARQIEHSDQATPRDREYAAIITAEADRLITMSSNVLALNRFESQQVVGDARTYALDEQLRRCVLMLQDAWEAKGLDLDLNLAPAPVYANEEMLVQVWLNVLDNAIKYSPAGGRVAVTCHAYEDGQVSATVTDEGPGMDEATLRRAFDKFYRGAQTASQSPGNGLGLPIVKRIVELSRGTVSVRTEPAKGTAVTITLPSGAYGMKD